MADPFSRPRVAKNKQNTRLSYELPNRIHTARTYPILSPNGSSIIIYGQENGVKIVWRGGRSFKPLREQSAAPKGKSNGAHDTVVLLDSDEEETSSSKFEDKPEFEDDEEDFDPANPYPAILQTLDLYFGTDVLHLAVLPASLLRAEGASWKSVEPIKQKIVFTAACADNSVRLVTIPLTPPSPLSKARPEFKTDFTAAHAGKGNWGETVTTLSGHHKQSDGVSMTADFLPSSSIKTESSGKTEAHLIIASHSREVTGLVYLYRQSIKSPKHFLEPFQTVYLASPATKISFNPSLSGRRNSQLLVADYTGSCRIYDFKTLVKSPIAEDDNPVNGQGSWLLSLYPGFQKDAPNGAHAGFGRKTIIDAKWVAGGGAIVILLHDGEWAVWDIEGVGPGAPQGLLGRQGIKGGSRSNYSISGWIESGLKSSVSQSSGIVQNSKFVPMTPGTRRTTDIFHNKSLAGGPVRGEISVIELAPTSPTNPAEETVVFWYGESFTAIPNLSKYWAANIRKGAGSGSLFNNNLGARMIRLDGIDLQGERCTGIDQIAKPGSVSGLPTEVMILGEHRFTLWFSGKSTSQQIVLRPEVDEMDVDSDGELDMIGIDQALSRMEHGNGANPPKRKMISR